MTKYTGLFRVRKGLFGSSVLQECIEDVIDGPILEATFPITSGSACLGIAVSPEDVMSKFKDGGFGNDHNRYRRW